MRAIAPLPTRPGDVLILHTSKTFKTYAIGPVAEEGQRDFCGRITTVRHLSERDAVIARAEWLVTRGSRILVHDLDTGLWSEILHGKEGETVRCQPGAADRFPSAADR